MKITIHQRFCTVTRDPGDPVFRGTQNAAGESRLLYHVKNLLNKMGHSASKGGWIKKRMWKDGHLVDDMQQYIRVKKAPKDDTGILAIYNPTWAIKGAEEDFNTAGTTELWVLWGDNTPTETIKNYHIEIGSRDALSKKRVLLKSLSKALPMLAKIR